MTVKEWFVSNQIPKGFINDETIIEVTIKMKDGTVNEDGCDFWQVAHMYPDTLEAKVIKVDYLVNDGYPVIDILAEEAE